MKIKVFCQTECFLNDPFLTDYFEQYFELIQANENFDPNYDIACYNPLRRNLIPTNRPIINDSIWEIVNMDKSHNPYDLLFTGAVSSELPNSIQVPKWFWYHTHYYINPKELYNPYSYDKPHTFLMPIRILGGFQHRNDVLELLDTEKDNALYSVVEQGKTLDPGEDMTSNDRHYNPDWYNKTHFSVVLETYMTHLPQDTLFITEKTYKPICYGHAFIIMSYPGTLKALRDWGFVTFDNLFDESYDTETDYNNRLRMVIDNIKNVDLRACVSPETIERIHHNQAVFRNKALVQQGLYNDIVKPIQEFLKKE